MLDLGGHDRPGGVRPIARGVPEPSALHLGELGRTSGEERTAEDFRVLGVQIEPEFHGDNDGTPRCRLRNNEARAAVAGACSQSVQHGPRRW